MSEGRVRQIGVAAESLRTAPRKKFVADFVGRSTFIDGRMDGLGASSRPAASSSPAKEAAPATPSLALRPERLALMSAAAPAMDNKLPQAPWSFISYLGSQVDLHVRLSPQETRHRADPEPTGTAAAGDRRTGPYRLEQIDRPRISIIISANQHPEASTMTRSKSRREVLLGAAALAGAASLPRVASAQARPHRPSAPGAAIMPACLTRTSRRRC